MHELGPVLGGGVVQQLVAGHRGVQLRAHVAAGRGRHGQGGGHAGGGGDIAGQCVGQTAAGPVSRASSGSARAQPGRKQLGRAVQTGTLQVGKCRNNNIVLAPQRVRGGEESFSFFIQYKKNN